LTAVGIRDDEGEPPIAVSGSFVVTNNLPYYDALQDCVVWDQFRGAILIHLEDAFGTLLHEHAALGIDVQQVVDTKRLGCNDVTSFIRAGEVLNKKGLSSTFLNSLTMVGSCKSETPSTFP